MTHAEILERVKKKSTICSKCGCFVSSLLDCCPACGHAESIGCASASESYLANSYASMGGNAASNLWSNNAYNVLKIGEDGSITKAQKQSFIVIDNLTDIGTVKAQIGQVVYVADTNQLYIYSKNQQWTQIDASSLFSPADYVETTTLGSTTSTFALTKASTITLYDIYGNSITALQQNKYN